jgi:hypothetical protein
MPKTRPLGKACGDWAGAVEACVVTQGPHVRAYIVSKLGGLTQLRPAIFDEYTRRQFVAKAPERNPFGEEEEPNKFDDFDVFTKIRVLQQLSTWTLNNPNSIRERLGVISDSEQAFWVSLVRWAHWKWLMK